MHTLLFAQSSQQIQGGERKQLWSRGSCINLTPVQQAQIVKYALAIGNKAAILWYMKETANWSLQQTDLLGW